MTVRLDVILDFRTDFHVGTGAGRGGVVDAAIVRDRYGRPIVPGSTLKGLARETARQLGDMYPELDRGAGARVFGVSGGWPGAVDFDRAIPMKDTWRVGVRGRSSRNRETGRARDDFLFRVEEASASQFRASVTAPGALDDASLTLLIAALRRIEVLGGQRRRGKGHVAVTVKVVEGPQEWVGTQVPGNADHFERSLRKALQRNPGPTGSPPISAPSPSAIVASREQISSGAAAAESVATAAPEGSVETRWGVLMVLARSEAPLILTASPETGNLARTHGHIPGTSVRGAIAAALLRSGWDANSTAFAEIFVREGIHFGPLFPSLTWAGRCRSMPFTAPRSVLTCKLRPGIRGDAVESHGVVDVLGANTKQLLRCGEPGCDAALVPFDSILQHEIVEDPAQHLLRRVDVPLQTSVHTEIDAETERAKDGMLYAQELVPEDTWFGGYLWGRLDLLASLRHALGAAREGVSLGVGKARTRGHGGLRVFLYDPPAQAHPLFPAFLPSKAVDAGRGFTVTLYSDLVAIDELLRPVTRLDEKKLWMLIGGTDDPPFRLDRGYVATRLIAGFNGVPGRPRTVDVAIAAGSCWRFSWADGRPTQDDRELLERAGSRGLGMRRGEGFGRIVLNLPIHAASLDQTRSKTAEVGAVMAGWRAEGLPGHSRPQLPTDPLTTRIPDGLRSEPARVRDEDRTGVARLLADSSRHADPASILSRAIENRKRRQKPRSGTDRALESLRDALIDRRLRAEGLRACASEIDRLEAASRSPKQPEQGASGG